MTSINQPRTTVNIINANQSVSNTGQRVLIVGQKLSAGTAVAGQLYQQIDNSNDYKALFGAASQVANTVRAFKRRNKATRVDVIPLSDAGGTSFATIVFTITGTATASGVLRFVVGSKRDHTFEVAVTSGDAPTAVGAALVAAVAAHGNNEAFPYTAANLAGVVTFTARNGGTVANKAGYSVSGSVTGVSVALSATDGATDPSLTSVLDVIGDERYQGIVWPYAATAVVEEVLNTRFNVTGKVLDGVAFVPFTGTYAQAVSQITENSQSIVYLVDELENTTAVKGSSQLELGYKVAAYLAAIRALRLDSSAQSISDISLSTYGPLDSFGGPALASKPFFNTPLAFVDTNDIGLGFDDAEIENLADVVGATVYGNNIANNAVILGEVVTTYKTDSAANPDETFKYLNYVDTASQVREYFYNNLRARFAQSRLTEGDTQPGRDMANKAVIQSFCKRLYQALSGVDFVLVEAGEQALQFFIDNLVIAINKQTGTATIQMTVPIVTQLRTINATLKIAFSTTA